MSFNVYDSTGLAVNQLGQESPAIFSKYFELQECTNITTDVLNDPNMASHFNSLMHISGVATAPPQIAYSTTWTNGPHSVLANKVNDLFKNDVFKMFASANPRYRPILLTDAWTQQYPKEGKKLSTSIAFRSYPIYQYNTSNYYEIFKLLFYCSAPKHYGFGDNIDFVMDAIEKSIVTGTEFGKIFGGMIDDFKTFTKDKNLHFTKQDLTDFDKELQENDKESDKASLVLNFKNAKGTDTKKKLIHSAATLVALLESFCQNTETACPRFMLKYGVRVCRIRKSPTTYASLPIPSSPIDATLPASFRFTVRLASPSMLSSTDWWTSLQSRYNRYRRVDRTPLSYYFVSSKPTRAPLALLASLLTA